MSTETLQNITLASGKFEKERKYWLKKLTDITAFELPVEYQRSKNPVRDYKKIQHNLSSETIARLYKLARNSDHAAYIILVAALKYLLYLYTSNEDIAVIAPIPKQSKIERGYINNILVLRTKINPEITFKEMLLRVKQTIVEADENQNYPIERLAKELMITAVDDRLPFSDVVVSMESIHDTSYFVHKRHDLSFAFTKESAETHSALMCYLEYDAYLFREQCIIQMAKQMENLLQVCMENLDQKIIDLEIISAEEKQKLLVDFNNTAAKYPCDKLIHQLFEEQADKHPDQIALIYHDQQMTYGELNEKADQLAEVLRKKGLTHNQFKENHSKHNHLEQNQFKNQIVGIMVERSFGMIVGLLGILKAGGAYLPIDPDYPEERINLMIEDSKIEFILTQKSLKNRIKFTGEIICLEDIEFSQDNQFGNGSGRLNHIENYQLPDSKVGDLAYLIYTSGSTGRPKGVLIEHRNVVNFITGITSRIEFSSDSTIMALTTISFDIFVLETFLPLTKGAKIVIADENQQYNMSELKDLLIKNNVTMLQITPSRLKILADTDPGLESLKGIKVLMVGGEPFPVQLLTTLQNSTAFQGRIYNMYGPTETTVWSTVRDLTDLKEINIGKPISNTQIYILNQNNRLTPLGVKGELCIGGDSVARGYLNNPQLTEERFIPNSLDKRSERIYRTGDLARWLPDGNIEFLGRKDNQVKIRGYRIELGEIESQLLNHDSVSEAIVIDKTDPNGDKYLCAYLVVGGENLADDNSVLSVAELRDYLAQKLPEYMIPSYFIYLDRLPLTPNGKINRKALPEPDGNINLRTEYVPPRTETERLLVQIWSEILGVDQIGINDNFFTLGGQSFKGMLISSRILNSFDVKISIRKIFENPTIKELAEYIDGASKRAYVHIEPINSVEGYPTGCYPTSSAQKRLYILNKFDTNGISYNIPYILTLDKDIDKERLESTLNKLIKRHEALRTSFKMVDNQVVQVIHQDVELQVTYSKTGEENLTDVIKANIQPFDLSKAPLLHAGIIETETRVIFVLDVHHIIFDGFSMEILVNDFKLLYEGQELPELRIQYKDFTVWQNKFLKSEEMKKQEEYWLEKFSGELLVLNLPTDFPRPTVQEFAGAHLNFKVNQSLTSRLKEMSLSKGVTLHMILLAAYYVLLARYSNQEDIIIGTPHAGRHHSGLENVIGMFVNTLAFRGYPSFSKTFAEFLYEIREETLETYENQDYQFETLVQKLNLNRDTSRNPIFDVLFVLQNISDNKADDKNSINFDVNLSRFDLTLTGLEVKDGIKLILEYRTKLFKEETIEKLARHYVMILNQITENPDVLISDIDFLSVDEKNKILYEFNSTEVIYQPETIHQLFEKQVDKTPEKIALVFEDTQISYNELNKKANQLARTIRKTGIKQGQIIGLMAQRSINLMIGILGILKAGGAYLPIDPVYPEERIKYMLDHSKVNVLITQKNLEDKVEFHGEKIYLDQEMSYHEDTTNLTPLTDPDDLAYVIYTSGSTGKPKGVMIENKAVHNFIIGVTERIDFNSEKSILCVTTISFDIFVLEALLPLTRGLKIIITTEEQQINPQRLSEVIQKTCVEMIQSTPSRIQMLASYDPELTCLQDVQEIMIGGEAFPEELLKKLQEKTHAGIYNMYGPTETTVWSTIQNLTTKDGVDVGKPIANTRIYILDKKFNLLPAHIVGELYIGGDGVARGYLNRPDLDEERFIPDPFNPDKKIYRTGDLAMWLSDGNIKLFGRVDHQVKIRGYRIELGEIENQLLRYDPVTEAAVIDQKDEDGNKYLCAYISATRELSVNELRVHLSQTLTDYMIPAYFVQLDEIPKTPNGKIDRNSLPKPDKSIFTGNEYVKYRNKTEEKLVEIWSELFGISKDKLSVKDKFFEIGGDSMKVIHLTNLINEEFESELQVSDLFKYTTIEMLAEFLAGKEDPSEEEEIKFVY